ncbi:MAG: sensor histidine kinase [Treponema sp.]|jgi:two-component system sensor histidine kinase YesM|nr:sensor histidine kinase [Treponema sp.]
MKKYYLMSIIPFSVLIIILLVSIICLGKSYDDIVVNITTANKYNLTFKHDVDYALYRTVIGSANKWDTTYDKEIKDPYKTIANMRNTMLFLKNRTSKRNTLKRIDNILSRLDSLKNMADTLNKRVAEKGHYDENMRFLELNVYILTELITEQVYEYIYYEAENMNELRMNLNRMLTAVVLTGIAAFILILTRLFATNKEISKSVLLPIEELCEATGNIAKGNFRNPTTKKYDYEISLLSSSINNMSKEISRLLQKTKEEQEHLRLTELQLYQSQINPHFLYNTLDTIIALVESRMADQAVVLIERLSTFFRTTLSEGRSKIRVRDEVQHAASYLEIQEVRYQDIMDYSIDIDPGILDCIMIKLTLQPIVENALYHGIKQKRGHGHITIKGFRKKETLYFLVEDNGIGMDEKTLVNLRQSLSGRPSGSSKGFGLTNVHERLRLNYGDSYGLTIESKKNSGTKVFITLPVKNE